MTTEQLLAKLKQYPLALGLGGAALVVGLVVYFLRMPRVPVLQEELRQLESDWQTVDNNLREGIGLEEDLEQAEAFLAEAENRLIDPDDGPLNLAYFFDLGEETGVNITLLNPSAPEEIEGVKDYRSVRYDVAATGPFANVMELLYRIERSDRLTRVNTLTLAEDGQTSAGNVAIAFEVVLLAINPS